MCGMLLRIIDATGVMEMGTEEKERGMEFQPPESCYHSNYTYLHQRLLSIVSWFSNFVVKPKINHTYATPCPPESKYIGQDKSLPRNIIFRALIRPKSGEWVKEGKGRATKTLPMRSRMLPTTVLDRLCDWERRLKLGKESQKRGVSHEMQ